MSYPRHTKNTVKDIKSGYKRFVGHASGWQAHLKKGCTMTCWYCHMERSGIGEHKWRQSGYFKRQEALDALVKEAQERGEYGPK